MQNLRAAVWPFHEKIEKAVCFAPLAQGQATKEQYIRCLELLHGFFAPLEKAISDFKYSSTGTSAAHVFLESMTWSRVGLIEQDLLLLGLTKAEIENLPLSSWLPRIERMEHALGCLYLLEGSRLGGKVIASHVKYGLGLDENSGCAYFSSNGKDVGPLWRKFKDVVGEAMAPDTEPFMIDAAVQCFQCLKRWVERAPNE